MAVAGCGRRVLVFGRRMRPPWWVAGG